MSDQSAIRLLQTAIENVRETCTGPEYKDLVKACGTADEYAEKALGTESASEDAKEQPKDLKSAAAKARTVFKQQRKDARATGTASKE